MIFSLIAGSVISVLTTYASALFPSHGSHGSAGRTLFEMHYRHQKQSVCQRSSLNLPPILLLFFDTRQVPRDQASNWG